ncbi:LLM class flavin-dependent oxidoreductase [Calidifontibacter sp. DB0510]|uniref:LLM class flavin-dependent oxidoreductase n=1 Tax=Metallococcus carri TaxID=1656884 RepID=A0A967B1R8_9MICO|nr:LLM class flavin-dependent oxidoreductase [Metallococcus carri]NHN55918.1 LLM class flavin-dependent oxidoreductase [Metallococcus carri]NOP38394.1 LLM class flavin-dependent oxidoreductase [Calidifontibacter sp. DB2511S]
MQRFGFLSFGHYGPQPGSTTQTAADSLLQAIELAQLADERKVDGAYFRVHHFATQGASPIPLLSAIAATTSHIEVGTGVIDMRYENPLQLAEEAAALDIISGGRLALGVSRGSPEPALRGYEAFGYTGSSDPRGADMAREKFDLFLRAVEGEDVADADPRQFGPGARLPIEPRSDTLRSHIWWGAGTRETAEWAGRLGVNLMSSTLLTETTGASFADLQAEQIQRFRAAWKDSGHEGEPRVSVSRSIFPVVTEQDARMFGLRGDRDQVGTIDGFVSTFGKTYTATPDRLIEELRADAAVMDADTLMITIPTQLGPQFAMSILDNFATHVAPALGWRGATSAPLGG